MLPFKEVQYQDSIAGYTNAILAADIGGTNCNFGIFDDSKGRLQLLLSIHMKSKEIADFAALVKEVLAYLKQRYNIIIARANFAAAGVVTASRDRSKPTNLPFYIDLHAIADQATIEYMVITNDFEVIGYGLDLIDPKYIVATNKGVMRMHGNKAIIGAGTGLGKSILYWNNDYQRYVALASEGGHADCAIQDDLELELVNHIKKTELRSSCISWEDLLSGQGIERIYQFFCHKYKKGGRNGIIALKPDAIFNRRNQDENSSRTCELYTTIYARCVKNFALDALALGGIYIAGGIAAKNLPLFQSPSFYNEFISCGKQRELLKSVPVYVIVDYNVSLFGAAQYLLFEKQ